MNGSTLKHKGCGGEIFIDVKAAPYIYELDYDKVEWHYPIRCCHCGGEISGDQDLEDLEDVK